MTDALVIGLLVIGPLVIGPLVIDMAGTGRTAVRPGVGGAAQLPAGADVSANIRCGNGLNV
ncbi:hypothetical protein AB0C27_37070 [Nonomuraea sp. NPDC048882]|uniref:hypothetical protein n=1 Tax=unclassified Nonomuraea TaxID=2593643 RepID=UPI000A9A4DB5